MALVWIIVCVLFLTGVVLAALDITSDDGAGAAAEAAGGSLPLDEPVPAATPMRHRPVAPAATATGPDLPAMTSARRVSRQREADVLIDRLLVKIRAEKEARRKARAEAKRKAGN